MPKILLDYGHGGNDPGAIGYGLKEKDFTLQIGKKVKNLLENQGFKVIETRQGDNTISLVDRRSIAIKNNVDVVLSIHHNAFTQSLANGYETWIRKQATNRDLQLANTIHNSIVKAKLFNTDRGIKKEDFSLVTIQGIPSVLLELGFITNQKDLEVIKNKQNEMSIAITKGMCKYWGMDYKAINQTKQEKKSVKLYRVQVGAFSVKANADRLVKELKGKGYNAIIV